MKQEKWRFRLGKLRISLLTHGGALVLHGRLLKCKVYSKGLLGRKQKHAQILKRYTAIIYVCSLPS